MALKFGELWGELRIDDGRLVPDIRKAGDRGADEMGKAGDDAGDQFTRRTANEIDGGSARVRDAAEQVGEDSGSALAERMSTGAEGMKDGLGSVIEGAGIPLEMGAAGIGLAAGAALAGAVSRALDQEAVTDKLVARLDLPPSEASSAGRAAGALWAGGFGESMGDVSDSLDAVMSTDVPWDASGQADLEGMTTKAMTFAEVMDQDVADSMMTASILVRNKLFPDATTALDGITVALQRMPTAMRGELFPVLDEYSTYLTTLGMDGSEQLAFLAEASKGGAIQLDKAGDAMKELSIRATDLTDSGAQDALRMMGFNGQEVANSLLEGGDKADNMRRSLLSALSSIKDPAAQAQMALALFGTPLEDMNKASIPEFITMLNGAQTGLGDTSGAVDKLGSGLDNNARTVETWKRDVSQKLTDMAAFAIENFPKGVETIGDMIGESGNIISWGVAGVKGFVESRWNDLVDFITGMPGRVTDAASGMWDGIQDAFKGAMNWIIDRWNGLSLTLPSVSTPFGDIGGWTIDTPNIPRFHSGGVLGGRIGQEQMFMGLGGETIRTVEQERQLQTMILAMRDSGARPGPGGGRSVRFGDINVNRSNASARDISSEIGWSLLTAGV